MAARRETESTRLTADAKDQLYRIGDRQDSYSDVVEQLIALHYAVKNNPHLEIHGDGDSISVTMTNK
jgi:hypothetical protein